MPVAAQSRLGTPGSGTAAATAAAIGTNQACTSLLLTNTHATLSLKWGKAGADSQLTPLLAGGAVSIPCTNVTDIYVINGSGAATYVYQPVVDY